MSKAGIYVRLVFLAASVLLYGYSLSLPALLFKHSEALPGGTVLAWGWWGLLMFQFAWFANPAYAFAVISYVKRQRVRAAISCAVSLFLGITSFHAKEWWFNEGGGTPILGLGIGFHIWMLSFLCLLVGCAIPVVSNRSLNMVVQDSGAPVS